MPAIICPWCRTENRPAGLSALLCQSCGETIDPRRLERSAETFVRRQRKLRKGPGSSLETLGQDEADELLEWVLDLPDADVTTAEGASGRTFRRPIGLLTEPWRRWTEAARRQRREVLYKDSVVSMREDGIVINRYYWPLGRKRIGYDEVRSYTPRPLKAWHGQYRVHGIDHRGRWYSRDRHRGEKDLAIDLTVGRLIHPVLTPDDIDAVLEILDREVSIVSD